MGAEFTIMDVTPDNAVVGVGIFLVMLLLVFLWTKT